MSAAPSSASRPARPRWAPLAWVPLLVALGLGSRSRLAAEVLPRFITAYAGDTLWSSLVYVLLLTGWPRLPVRRAAASALGLSFLVEFSQLWHPPWLDALRTHRAVALVLGRGFVASDLLCYTVGVALAAGVDQLLGGKSRRPGAGGRTRMTPRTADEHSSRG